MLFLFFISSIFIVFSISFLLMVYITTLPSRWVTRSSKIINWETLNSHYYSVHSSLFLLGVLPNISGIIHLWVYVAPKCMVFVLVWSEMGKFFTMACHWVLIFVYKKLFFFFLFVNADEKFVVLLKS